MTPTEVRTMVDQMNVVYDSDHPDPDIIQHPISPLSAGYSCFSLSCALVKFHKNKIKMYVMPCRTVPYIRQIIR